jgi:transcription elongation factor Elf1
MPLIHNNTIDDKFKCIECGQPFIAAEPGQTTPIIFKIKTDVIDVNDKSADKYYLICESCDDKIDTEIFGKPRRREYYNETHGWSLEEANNKEVSGNYD